MKLLLSMVMLSALGSWSFAADMESSQSLESMQSAILVGTSGQCPYGYKETPTYKWDKVKRRWVYVGYTCYYTGGY